MDCHIPCFPCFDHGTAMIHRSTVWNIVSRQQMYWYVLISAPRPLGLSQLEIDSGMGQSQWYLIFFGALISLNIIEHHWTSLNIHSDLILTSYFALKTSSTRSSPFTIWKKIHSQSLNPIWYRCFFSNRHVTSASLRWRQELCGKGKAKNRMQWLAAPWENPGESVLGPRGDRTKL